MDTPVFWRFVRGVPKPQGSKKSFLTGPKAVVETAKKNGVRAQVVDDNPKALRFWRYSVSAALGRHWTGPPIDGPVTIGLCFTFLKPKSVPKSREFPTVKPDIDKLTRAVLDAMTGIVFADDSRGVTVGAEKVYGPETGVDILVLEGSHRIAFEERADE